MNWDKMEHLTQTLLNSALTCWKIAISSCIAWEGHRSWRAFFISAVCLMSAFRCNSSTACLRFGALNALSLTGPSQQTPVCIIHYVRWIHSWFQQEEHVLDFWVHVVKQQHLRQNSLGYCRWYILVLHYHDSWLCTIPTVHLVASKMLNEIFFCCYLCTGILIYLLITFHFYLVFTCSWAERVYI